MRTPRLAGIAALLLASTSLAQDWPGWRGAARDGKLSGFKAPAVWPKELTKGWQVEVGGGHSTPALVDGKLYVHARLGGDEVTLCLEGATGREVWSDRVPVPFTPAPAAKTHGLGPFSSPVVAGGKVFTLGITGILSCLDAKDGKVQWRHDFKERFPETYPQWGAAMSPLVADGVCIAHVGGDKKGSIVAIDAATGKTKWSWDGDGPGYASPIAAMVGGKAQLITQTFAKAVGISPAEGKLLWELEYKTGSDQNSVTPVVLGNIVILSGTSKGVAAYKIDGARPEQAWQVSDVSMYMSSPVMKGERLYGFSEKKKGQFFCLNAKSGDTLWTSGPKQGENAALLDAGDVILALSTPRPDAAEPASLVVFEANEKEYKELARYKVSDAPAWAHPVVSGKSIFVKDRTKLTQWTLP